MPRPLRLDIPGLLQHVIVRGIEKRNIFLSDSDRQDFVGRLSSLLEQTETDCLAWSLMSNHFHLLLRPRKVALGTVMKRLLTGYAVSFNLRHGRSGHLFQNRFKSIVCDEDSYLLELVRYIHLNPLRAGIVATLSDLDRYPWCGHAVILGKKELAGQRVSEVLAMFGRNAAAGRRGYLAFIADGEPMQRRDELVGRKVERVSSGTDGPVTFDSRILGDEAFAKELRNHEDLAERVQVKVSIADIIAAVARHVGIAPKAVRSNSRSPLVSKARAVVSHLACSLGHTGASVGQALGMTSSAVCAARARGRGIMEKEDMVIAGICR